MAELTPGVHLERVQSGETVEAALGRVAGGLGAGSVHARVFGSAAGISVHALTPSGEQCVLDRATVGLIVQADALVDEEGFRCLGVVSVVLNGVPVTLAGRVEMEDALDVTLIVQASRVGSSEVAVGRPGASSRPSSPPAPSEKASPGSHARSDDRGADERGLATAAPSSPWARVAAVSSRVQEDEGDEEEYDSDDLVKGDVLLHPKLGRCRVLMLTGVDAVKVQVPSGSPRKLMLRPFRIYRVGDTREFELRLRS